MAGGGDSSVCMRGGGKVFISVYVCVCVCVCEVGVEFLCGGRDLSVYVCGGEGYLIVRGRVCGRVYYTSSKT